MREDLILRSDDEEIDDISGGNNLAGGNTLDVESAVGAVLGTNSANDNEKTIPAKDPDLGSQASLIDSLTQAFTSSKKTSSARAGKIAELVNSQPCSQGFSALGKRLVLSMLVRGGFRSQRSKNELKSIHRQKTANRELKHARF